MPPRYLAGSRGVARKNKVDTFTGIEEQASWRLREYRLAVGAV
jgi:hypothetical protein